MSALTERRAQTSERTRELQRRLQDAATLVADKACVYAIGSFGRGEASPHSDLDLFILGKRDGKPKPAGPEQSLLNPLDEICLKADLIEAAAQASDEAWVAAGGLKGRLAETFDVNR